MSKPRSRLVGKPDSAFRTVRGYTTVLHFGKQAKHMPGQPGHDPSKSTITISITTLQHLVELRAGTGVWHPSGRETVNFGVIIGTYRDPSTGLGQPTAWGTIHYSKSGAHVVPASPNTRVQKGQSS